MMPNGDHGLLRYIFLQIAKYDYSYCNSNVLYSGNRSTIAVITMQYE